MDGCGGLEAQRQASQAPERDLAATQGAFVHGRSRLATAVLAKSIADACLTVRQPMPALARALQLFFPSAQNFSVQLGVSTFVAASVEDLLQPCRGVVLLHTRGTLSGACIAGKVPVTCSWEACAHSADRAGDHGCKVDGEHACSSARLHTAAPANGRPQGCTVTLLCAPMMCATSHHAALLERLCCAAERGGAHALREHWLLEHTSWANSNNTTGSQQNGCGSRDFAHSPPAVCVGSVTIAVAGLSQDDLDWYMTHLILLATATAPHVAACALDSITDTYYGHKPANLPVSSSSSSCSAHPSCSLSLDSGGEGVSEAESVMESGCN